MKKLSFLDPASIAIAAGAAHLAKNTAATVADRVDTKGKHYRKKPTSFKGSVSRRAGDKVHEYKTRAMRTGLLHGLDQSRKSPSPAWAAIEQTPVFGNEHLTFHYNLGYKLGNKYKHLPHEEKVKKLRELRTSLTSLPNHRDYPHVGAMVDGITHTVQNRTYPKSSIGGATPTLEQQRAKDIKKYLKAARGGRAGLAKFERNRAVKANVGLAAHKSILTVGDFFDPEKGVKRVLGPAAKKLKQTTGVDPAGAIKRRIAKNSLKKLGPDYLESRSDRAKNIAGRILLTPRVRDLNDAPAALRKSLKKDSTKTKSALKDIAGKTLRSNLS